RLFLDRPVVAHVLPVTLQSRTPRRQGQRGRAAASPRHAGGRVAGGRDVHPAGAARRLRPRRRRRAERHRRAARRRLRGAPGLRVGLITNQSGIDRSGNPTVDLLRSAPGVTLTAIFAPEHGLRGTADEKIADEQYLGIPVYSLYGDSRKPTAAQLANVDALVFDIQDIGTRFYTYISTMG